MLANYMHDGPIFSRLRVGQNENSLLFVKNRDKSYKLFVSLHFWPK